jgi:hypothetical protein
MLFSVEYTDTTRSKLTVVSKDDMQGARLKVNAKDRNCEDRLIDMTNEVLRELEKIELPKRLKGTFKHYKRTNLYKIVLREEIVEDGRTVARKYFASYTEHSGELIKETK